VASTRAGPWPAVTAGGLELRSSANAATAAAMTIAATPAPIAVSTVRRLPPSCRECRPGPSAGPGSLPPVGPGWTGRAPTVVTAAPLP
jgi:hypothetical protein